MERKARKILKAVGEGIKDIQESSKQRKERLEKALLDPQIALKNFRESEAKKKLPHEIQEEKKEDDR